MIGVAENDLCAKVFQNVLRDGLDRPSRAAWHERRRLHRPMRGFDSRKSCRSGVGLDGEGKGHESMVLKSLTVRLPRQESSMVNLECGTGKA